MRYLTLCLALIVCLFVVGCAPRGDALIGTYTGKLDVAADSKNNPAAMAAAGQTGGMELKEDHTFDLSQGTLAFKGKWTLEADKLTLKADTMNGEPMPTGKNAIPDFVGTVSGDNKTIVIALPNSPMTPTLTFTKDPVARKPSA